MTSKVLQGCWPFQREVNGSLLGDADGEEDREVAEEDEEERRQEEMRREEVKKKVKTKKQS